MQDVPCLGHNTVCVSGLIETAIWSEVVVVWLVVHLVVRLGVWESLTAGCVRADAWSTAQHCQHTQNHSLF